jgi:hypothetical protein
MSETKLLNWDGKPFQLNGHTRHDLFGLSAASKPRGRRVNARYEAAQDTDEFSNWWAGADSLDADSANSIEVRRKLVSRSRQEVENNGYMDGMVQTHANYVVGIAPTLRMQTGNEGFNRVVELIWYKWAKAIQLRRKLWCMQHAKVQDGEAFAIIVNNPGLPTRIKLDIQLIETEQVQSTNFNLLDENHIDGIKFDRFGNVLYYDVLPHHPGSSSGATFDHAHRVPARFMLHWFTLRRPGQHRGVPEFRSTLNCGASSRRFRQATVRAAEVAATLGSVVLESGMAASEVDPVEPLSTVDLELGMMTALPTGWKASQMDGKHPNAEYAAFFDQQINETGRPKSMPKNIAKSDSSQYNYASGRLDHQTYFLGNDVERADCDDVVLDKLFGHFYDEAKREYDWDDFDNTPDHLWDWPKHPVADIKSESLANDTKLKNGAATLPRVYAEAGLDAEDEAQKAADYFGIDIAEYKRRQLDALFPPQVKGVQDSKLADAIEKEEANAKP